MPLPEDIQTKNDILTAQREPGFETERLPSPAQPEVAPIAIPGTGLAEGNDGASAYLAEFNKSILGTKDKVTPGNLPVYTASSVFNPRYNSILPGEDSEEAFAQGQPWTKKWGNALVKTAATAVGTFMNGMMAIPDTIMSIGNHSPYNTPIGQATDSFMKNMEDEFPNYYTKWEQKHPFMSAMPFSGGFANFWGDKFIKNLGFTVGAIGSALVQDFAVGAATEGLGEIPMIGQQLGKASLWLNKLFSTETAVGRALGATSPGRLTELLDLGRSAGRTGDQLFDLQTLARAAAAKKVTNGVQYALNLYGASAAEAGFEARDGYNTVKDDLIKAYQNEKGYSPMGKDLEEIEKYATASGNVRFGVNMALLGMTNTIALDGILKPWSVAKAGYRSAIQKEIEEAGSIQLAKGGIDTFEKYQAKGFVGKLWNSVRPMVPAIISEGFLEEGGQYAAQVGTENYYERKFLYDKGLSKEGYKKDTSDWDSRDQVGNITHSIVRGLADEFGTQEGAENIVLGALTGVVFGGVEKFLDREKSRNILQSTLSLLNSHGVTGIIQNQYDSAAKAQRISEDMKTAVKTGDLFKYKNFQHEQLVNFITSGIKAGRFDVRLEQLNLLKDLSDDEFKKAFGIEKTPENTKTAGEYIDAVINKANSIKKTYDLVNDTFQNPFTERPRSTNPDDVKETAKHQLFEHWKDSLTYLASIASDADQRLKSISSDLRTINPNLEHYNVANFVDKTFLKSYSGKLRQEVKSLQSLLDQKVSGDPKADEQRIKSLNVKANLIDMYLADPKFSDKRFEGLYSQLLNYQLNGENDDGPNKIPQEAIPKLMQYGRDVLRIREYRKSAYDAFDKLSSKDGIEKYFSDAESAQQKYADSQEDKDKQRQKEGTATPPPPGQQAEGTQAGTPAEEVPTVQLKTPKGDVKLFDQGKDYFVNITGKKGDNPQRVQVVSQNPDGTVTVLKSDGTNENVPVERFFEADKGAEELDKHVDDETKGDDTPPPPPGPTTATTATTEEGDRKKDLSFALYSTTDPVYTRQDIPFSNFHRRHQNFLYDMGSSDPDVFNQDNKAKLRIIPVTASTAKEFGFPVEFTSPVQGEEPIIRGVYVIDDTIDPVKRGRQRDSILSDIEKSTTIPEHIKANVKTDPDTAISQLYEQIKGVSAGTDEMLGEKLVDKITDYATQGMFFTDSKGEKLGALGSPVDPNQAIFTTLADASLTRMNRAGVEEERYTNKDNIDPKSAKDWWNSVRADILSDTTMQQALRRTYQFEISRGMPNSVNNGSRNNVVQVGLIREQDLDKPIITIATLGNVAVLGAFNAEEKGIASFAKGVKMPLGQVLLNYGGNLTFLNARQFTSGEANNIFEMLKIIADRGTEVDKGPLFKYLHKIIYLANPKEGVAPTASSITIHQNNLFLGKDPNPIFLHPEVLDEEKARIIGFLENAHHAVKNKEILRIANNPKASDLQFVELKAEDGKVSVANTWKNYNHYLLSNKDPEGKTRSNEPLSVNLVVPQEGERPIKQKYSVIQGFDFNPAKLQTPKEAEVTQAGPISSVTEALAKISTDIKARGVSIENLNKLKEEYDLDNSLTDPEVNLLTSVINGVIKKLEDKAKEQGVKQAETKVEEKEEPETKEEPEAQPTISFIEQTLGTQGLVKLGFVVTQRDENGNITDIEPKGVVQDDGSIKPYKNAELMKSFIMERINASQIKQDDTNSNRTEDIKNKFRKGNFRKGTDKFRMFQPGTTDYKKADLDKEFAEMKAILPDFFTFKKLDYMLRTTGGGKAWGALRDNMIRIYKDAEVGTTYHEAFEAVWYHFLTGKEQQDLYDEFKTRKGGFITYNGQRRDFSDASLKEAKEQLAEEFRDFRITGEKPVQAKNRSFFQRLVDFIKWMLGMETSKRNELFDRMNKGYYRNFSTSLRGPMSHSEYSYYREPGLENFSETVVQDVLQGMTAELFGRIFGENSSIIDQLEEHFEITAKSIYDRLKSDLNYYFTDEVAEEGTLFADFGDEWKKAQTDEDGDAIIQQMESVRDLWSKISQNWDSFVKEHERYLRIFNVEFTVDDEGEMDIAQEDDVVDDSKSQSEYDRDIMTIDAKEGASPRVKLLIASIADSEWVKEATKAGMAATDSVRSKRESSTVRLPKLVQYAKLFNYLLHNLAGINTIYDQWKKLNEMTEDVNSRKAVDANVRKLMNRLKFTKGFEQLTESDVRLILSMENTLSKQKPAFFRQFTDWQRNTWFDTTQINNKVTQLTDSWISKIRGSESLMPSSENKFIFSKKILGIRDPIDFLNKIGIDITKSDVNKLRGKALSDFYDATNRIKGLVEGLAETGKSIPVVSAKQLDFKTRLEKLADLYTTYVVGEDTQSQHPNMDNEQTSNFVLNNYVSTIMNDANHSSTRDEFINKIDNQYFNDIFHKDSIILNRILFDDEGKFRRAVEVGVVEGRETWDRNNKGTNRMTEAERQLYEINNNLNGVFYTLLPADAKTEWSINVGTYLSAAQYFGDDSTRSNVITAFGVQMYKWLQTEVDLARDFENRKFIDNLNRVPKSETRPVGKSLRFFKDIMPKALVDQIHEKVIDGGATLDTIVTPEDMRAIMRTVAETKVQRTIKNLMDWKLIIQEEDGKLAHFGFDKAFMDEHVSKEKKITVAEMERLMLFREMNYMMNSIEMHKFFFGDPAQYKDELKRIKPFLSGREATHVDIVQTSEGFNQWANNKLNRVGDIALRPEDPGYHTFKNHFNTITLNDIIYESNEIETLKEALGKRSKPYTEGNEADGGAYMMAPAYREMLWKAGGRFNGAQEKQFQWEMAWERNDKAKEGKYTYTSQALRGSDETMLKEEPNPDVDFPILKLMHSGILTIDGVAVSSIDKASWAPLFYRWYKGKGLAGIYDAAQKNGIDYIKMESAHKVGLQKQSTIDMYGEDGKVNQEGFKTAIAEKIPMKQIGVQVEQKKKDKGQTEGSQLRKIAIGDLKENGVPIDFQKGYSSKEEAFRAWNNLETEDQKRAASPIYTKIKRHDEALTNLVTLRAQSTIRRLGMETDEDGVTSIPDKKQISDFILSELERRELPRNIASSIQISPETRDFSNPIEANPQYGKIRSIIYSVLEKTITRPKVNGGQKTMLSVTGMESGNRVVKRMVNGKPVYTSDVLKFYKKGISVTEECEVMLPYWFGKKLIEAGSGRTKEEVIKYLNSTEEGQKLLRGIGFRIPTQGLNSVDFFTVKDFLPEQMGSVVVLPSEITAKAGSDFDIDKLNTYLRNFYVGKNGFPKELKYEGSEAATKESILKLIQDGEISANSIRKDLENFIQEEVEDFEEEGIFKAEKNEKLIQDFLANRQTNLLDMYYQKTLENEYFDSIEGLLSDPENYSRLVSPNDASELKGYRDKILALKSASSTPLGDYGKLLDSVFMMQERQAYMASKQVVGVSAVSQTALAVYQNVDGGYFVEDPNIVARFPHTKIDGKIPLSGLFIHGTDRLISNINAQTTDGGVDVAKDKFLAEQGINQDTLSTFLTLGKMGADPWWAITFLNQPAIQEFLKQKAIGMSVSQINPRVQKMADKLLLQEVLKTFGNPGKNNINLKNKPSVYTITQMEEMIKKHSADPKSLSADENKLQMMMLDDFLTHSKERKRYEGYSSLAWELFHSYQGYNWDTARLNDPNLVRLKNLKYQKANDLMVTPISKIMDSMFLGEMRKQVLTLDQGLRSVINVQNGAAGSIIDQMARDISYMPGGEAAKQSMLLNTELSLVDYALHTNGQIQGRTMNTLAENLLLSNSTATAVYLDALRKNERYANNPFIKNLLPQIDRRPGYPSYIQMLERDYDTYTSNVWTDAFRELKDDYGTIIKIDDNQAHDKSVADVFKRIVLTAMLQSGSKKGRGSFVHLIPSEVYAEITRDALKNMNVENFYENKVMYRTNWDNPLLVPDATMEYEKVGQGAFQFVDPNSQPEYKWFEYSNILNILRQITGKEVPTMLTQPSFGYWNKKIIRLEETERDPQTNQITGRRVRLFRRVDTYGENGIVPLQYDRKRVIFTEINAWGDGSKMQEYYQDASPSVLATNNHVNELSDDQILYALYKDGVKTNASDFTLYDVVSNFEDEGPGENDPNTPMFQMRGDFDDFKDNLQKKCD